jgi:16S rRNA (cytosine1402-N4)-methyltransferase
MTQNDYHIPVLLEACIQGLNIQPDGVYVDVTFGGGGHSTEILKQLNKDGKLIGFDQDPDARNNSIQDERFVFIPENFKFLKRFLRFHGITEVDGILADFGVSSHQFNTPKRGFSIRFDAKLDMRMDQNQKESAYEVINEYSYEQLTTIFRQYAEIKMASKLVNAIIKAREAKPIETTFELNAVIEPFFPKHKSNKFLAQIYQALRIEVNAELDAMKDFLSQACEILKPGRRLCLISYHSLEDRLVKHFIRSGNFEDDIKKDLFGNILKPLKNIGKLIVPSAEEIANNNRARSAKLRIAEKL